MVYADTNGFWKFNYFTRPLGDDQNAGIILGGGDDRLSETGTGTYTVTATFDRVNSTTPGNVLVGVTIGRPTGGDLTGSFDIVDIAGANQVGWRDRHNQSNVALSMDNLRVVPEPAPLALTALGLLALLAMRRRPRRRAPDDV
jgi:hypothetical protein